MDIALALWQINPAYAYTLTDDGTAVAEWRSTDPQPTVEQLQAAWSAYHSAQSAADQAKAAADAQRAADHAAVIAGLTALGQPDAAAALARLLGGTS